MVVGHVVGAGRAFRFAFKGGCRRNLGPFNDQSGVHLIIHRAGEGDDFQRKTAAVCTGRKRYVEHTGFVLLQHHAALALQRQFIRSITLHAQEGGFGVIGPELGLSADFHIGVLGRQADATQGSIPRHG